MTTEQINSIIVEFDLGQEYFVWQMEHGKGLDEDARLERFFDKQTFDTDNEKILALMECTGDDWEDAESQIDSDYLVLTDEEADEKLDERLEHHIDDCVLINIDPSYHEYFDRDSWKSDNKSDRGSWIAYTDGYENEECINKTTYYIYKQ